MTRFKREGDGDEQHGKARMTGGEDEWEARQITKRNRKTTIRAAVFPGAVDNFPHSGSGNPPGQDVTLHLLLHHTSCSSTQLHQAPPRHAPPRPEQTRPATPLAMHSSRQTAVSSSHVPLFPSFTQDTSPPPFDRGQPPSPSRKTTPLVFGGNPKNTGYSHEEEEEEEEMKVEEDGEEKEGEEMNLKMEEEEVEKRQRSMDDCDITPANEYANNYEGGGTLARPRTACKFRAVAKVTAKTRADVHEVPQFIKDVMNLKKPTTHREEICMKELNLKTEESYNSS
ncbi:hypothetical protein O3P69_004151 [Scylla paramamosain]|uniref:Uncharacterized protein n=1 Tax=Scylla paramamosain TaxID=85552 RepID=A0AAW0UGS9_SCYPA